MYQACKPCARTKTWQREKPPQHPRPGVPPWEWQPLVDQCRQAATENGCRLQASLSLSRALDRQIYLAFLHPSEIWCLQRVALIEDPSRGVPPSLRHWATWFIRRLPHRCRRAQKADTNDVLTDRHRRIWHQKRETNAPVRNEAKPEGRCCSLAPLRLWALKGHGGTVESGGWDAYVGHLVENTSSNDSEASNPSTAQRKVADAVGTRGRLTGAKGSESERLRRRG